MSSDAKKVLFGLLCIGILAALIGPGFWFVSQFAFVLINPITWVVILVLVFSLLLIKS